MGHSPCYACRFRKLGKCVIGWKPIAYRCPMYRERREIPDKESYSDVIDKGRTSVG